MDKLPSILACGNVKLEGMLGVLSSRFLIFFDDGAIWLLSDEESAFNAFTHNDFSGTNVDVINVTAQAHTKHMSPFAFYLTIGNPKKDFFFVCHSIPPCSSSYFCYSFVVIAVATYDNPISSPQRMQKNSRFD